MTTGFRFHHHQLSIDPSGLIEDDEQKKLYRAFEKDYQESLRYEEQVLREARMRGGMNIEKVIKILLTISD